MASPRKLTKEMSRYVDIVEYHAVERDHAFYEDMLAYIINALNRFKVKGKKIRLLEWGAGTGLVTEELAKLDHLNVTALEYDSDCYNFLCKHLEGKGVDCVHGDILNYFDEGGFDIVLSVFAHDHVHYNKANEEAGNIRRNLRRGGRYIMGGELIPYYETLEERTKALVTYHSIIVDQALAEQNFRLAQLEIDALESGVKMIGDFKRHEVLFENEMETSGFNLSTKEKIGPLDKSDVGGVFVYIYER
jgi:SAM-dependent methyltransferase